MKKVSNCNKDHKSEVGFTIIELMLVVSIIGVLSAVTISVMNIERQKDIAKEASIRTNMVKVCSALRAYGEAEAVTYAIYPAEGDNNNPLDSSASDADIVAFYLTKWPEGLVYNTTITGNQFSVYVKQSITDNFWKCTSRYWDYVRECNLSEAQIGGDNYSRCN